MRGILFEMLRSSLSVVCHLPAGSVVSSPDTSAHPGEVETLRRKGFAPMNLLEQILIAKVFNFGGICSK